MSNIHVDLRLGVECGVCVSVCVEARGKDANICVDGF